MPLLPVFTLFYLSCPDDSLFESESDKLPLSFIFLNDECLFLSDDSLSGEFGSESCPSGSSFEYNPASSL